MSLLLVSLSKCISYRHVSPSILLFIQMHRVSHLTPSLLSGWLLTDVQVNIITTLHDTHGHTYIHHISNTILLPSLTSSPLLGWPAGSDPSCLIHLVFINYYAITMPLSLFGKCVNINLFVNLPHSKYSANTHSVILCTW
jgi:hypothetical protein